MEIPRFQWDSPDGIARVAANLPVVLLNCPLSEVVRGTWNYDYMKEILIHDYQCDVYSSKSLRFQYWDTTKNDNGYKFTPPTVKERMSFSQFVSRSAPLTSTPSSSTMASILQLRKSLRNILSRTPPIR